MFSENHFDLDLHEAISAPPLSLSTPDLHDLTQQDTFQPLRRSASSSELLYEKAMQRFYQAVELDEAETAKKSRSNSVEPKSMLKHMEYTRVNDADDMNTYEKTLNRTSNSEKMVHNQQDKKISANSVQRPNFDTKIDFKSMADKYKNDWEDEYDRDLRREIIESQRKHSLSSHETTLPRELYEDDYTESTASSRSISIETDVSVESIEQFMNSVRSASSSTTNVRQLSTNDELETYHPKMKVRALSPYRTPEPGQATVILNKPVPLPDPDYVPKPILKRPPIEKSEKLEKLEKIEKVEKVEKVEKQPENEKSNTKEKEQPVPVPLTPKPEKEKKSFLQLFGKKTTSAENLKKSSQEAIAANNKKATDDSKSVQKAPGKSDEKEKVLRQRQNSIDENKVAIDHYSDLVKELGSYRTTKPKIPLYMNTEAMKEIEATAEMEDREWTAKRERDQLSSERNRSFSPTFGINQQHLDDPHELEALAKKMSAYTESNDLNTSTTEAPQKNLVEISVEQTKCISYAVRQIKQPNVTSNNESTYQVNAKSLIESTKTTDSHDNGKIVDTKEMVTRVRSSSRSRQPNNLRSQSKSPVSERKTSLTSTVLKVTRMPIENTSIDIDLPSSHSPSISPEPRCKTPEQMQTDAETNIRSTFSYTTDLVLFLLACWLYVFRDARLSIPVLILIVYRRVQNTLETKLQKWTKRKRQ